VINKLCINDQLVDTCVSNRIPCTKYFFDASALADVVLR